MKLSIARVKKLFKDNYFFSDLLQVLHLSIFLVRMEESAVFEIEKSLNY